MHNNGQLVDSPATVRPQPRRVLLIFQRCLMGPAEAAGRLSVSRATHHQLGDARNDVALINELPRPSSQPSPRTRITDAVN
jgi:hypothetical protein